MIPNNVPQGTHVYLHVHDFGYDSSGALKLHSYLDPVNHWSQRIKLESINIPGLFTEAINKYCFLLSPEAAGHAVGGLVQKANALSVAMETEAYKMGVYPQ